MLTVIVGHRGVGKSGFLARLKGYFESSRQNVVVADLDQLIETKSGKSILEIFDESGESHFRELERKIYEEFQRSCNSETPVFLAVGGGFDPTLIKDDARVIWLRRKTDSVGRVFLDRPPLNKELSPLEEFRERAKLRNESFESHFDVELTLPEGLTEPDPFEAQWVLQQLREVGGCVTLLPENFRSVQGWESFINERLLWGVEYFEIRDDLLSLDQIELAFQSIPDDQLIYSFRKKEAMLPDPDKLSRVALWDWALELGPCPFGSPSVVSLHDRQTNETLEAALLRLEAAAPKGAFLKLAPYIHNFTELEIGYRWMMAQAPKACFLPRSINGRWAWFRMLMKGRSPLNFIREGMGSGIDQPHLLEWVRVPEMPAQFAAVLGYPVTHSFTPIEHDAFFRAKNEPVFAVTMGEPEFNQAMPLLQEMGLDAAAITSPLKSKAYELAQELSPEARAFKAVNTLKWQAESKVWSGHSTDIEGLKALLSSVANDQSVVVWGGGGVLSQIQDLLPQAQFYSAREGQPRSGSEAVLQPDVVIWAAPRAAEYKWPLKDWQPKTVIDLNYREDSSGREYALMCKAEYISGLQMFKVQAEGQRRFWT